jgi:DinB family protein
MAETVPSPTYRQFLNDFEQTIRDANTRLQQIPADKSGESEPGKWSRKEILGHLIDSATNNHQRFVRSQFSEHLEFLGYEQERWVSVQHYNDEPWPDLIDLWRSYNLHLLHIVSNIPESVLLQPRTKHNLDQIAWQTVEKSEPTTLDYFVRDYLGHMKHHLDQIFS